METINYGLLDEAGDVGRKPGSSKHILVAVVLVHHKRELHQAVSRTRKRLGKKKRNLPEFKAFKTDPRIVRRLLGYIAAIECEIVAVVADKQHHLPGDEAEQLYRDLCAQAVERCLERHNRLSMILDKRYTNPKLRARQNEAILAVAETLPQAFLALEHLDSQQEHALQAADAIAWALFQKYEHRDDSFYNIVKAKIVGEKMWP
ncbi:MAG: DUF3800 domain-containing protein [Chloroflexota bacterium]